ncbi:MAG: DUF7336 domain-containing protein [Neobacillus sp.]
MGVYIVTCCPFYAEYNSMTSIMKVFSQLEDAEKYIEGRKFDEMREDPSGRMVNDYDIVEMELE